MKMKELDYSRSGCHRLGYKLEVVLVDKALLAGLVVHKSAVEVVELTNYDVVIQNDYYKTDLSTAELHDCDQLQVF